MAERTIEELAGNFTYTGANSFDTNSFAQPGGGGGGGGRNEYVPPYSIDPYTSPYIQPRVVVFTINTYASLSRKGVLAKAFLDGVEVEDQTSTKGKITFTINEQRLLNPSTLTIVSGDLKAQKYFLIQSRKDVENEVSVIEYDNTEVSPVEASPAIPVVIETPAIPVAIETPVFSGGGGGAGGFAGGGAGGGMREVNPNDFRGAGFGLADVTQRENLQ
jgi:hypothetical protein